MNSKSRTLKGSVRRGAGFITYWTGFGSMSLALQMLCLKASRFSSRFIAMQVFIEFEAFRMMFHLVSLLALQTS
uniref:Uncharacterized protein n=1 Tax=Caenorhabditis japonica TaxID=281687 RepID=A0A8R1ENM0_CAEJA